MADLTILMTPKDQASRTFEHVLVLEAGRAERHYWRDLWTYRELFAILAWRDLAVRYKQTAIGVAWAVDSPHLVDADLHRAFQPGRQTAECWACALRCDGVCRNVAVVLVLNHLERRVDQSSHEFQSDQQSLFSSAYRAFSYDPRSPRRLRVSPSPCCF